MNFSEALMQLRQGKHLRRRGWNGQGMHIELYPGATRPDGLWLQPHILMRTVQGTMVPWLASQSDLLAEDWEVCA